MSKSHRLTNSIRDAIIRNMERDILGERAKAINAEADELLAKLRDLRVPKEHQAAFNSLPSSFFPSQINCNVAINGHSRHLTSKPIEGFKSDYKGVSWPQALRGRIDLTTESVLGRQVEAHFDALDAFNEDRKALKTKAMAVLNSCTTIKRLLETWPEVEDWLPELPKSTAAGLPMVVISDLNGTIEKLKEAA